MNYGVEFEFEVVKNGVTRDACEYIEDDDLEDNIGLDGNSSIGEIRSEVRSTIPLAVKSAISYLMDFANDYSELKIGLDRSHPTGMHIHFGIKSFINSTSNRSKFKQVMTYCMNLLLPFFVKWNNYYRLNSDYWYDMATEDKVWGFEYRLIPSAFVKDKYFDTVMEFINTLSQIIYENIDMEEQELNKMMYNITMKGILDILFSNNKHSVKTLNTIRHKLVKNKRIQVYTYGSDIPQDKVDELVSLVSERYTGRHIIIINDVIYETVDYIKSFLKLYGNDMLFFPGTFIIRPYEDVIDTVIEKLKNEGYEHYTNLYRDIKSKSIKDVKIV